MRPMMEQQQQQQQAGVRPPAAMRPPPPPPPQVVNGIPGQPVQFRPTVVSTPGLPPQNIRPPVSPQQQQQQQQQAGLVSQMQHMHIRPSSNGVSSALFNFYIGLVVLTCSLTLWFPSSSKPYRL